MSLPFCHFDKMKFASLDANLGVVLSLLVYHVLLFALPLFGSSPDMTETLLTRALSFNSINQDAQSG